MTHCLKPGKSRQRDLENVTELFVYFCICVCVFVFVFVYLYICVCECVNLYFQEPTKRFGKGDRAICV